SGCSNRDRWARRSSSLRGGGIRTALLECRSTGCTLPGFPESSIDIATSAHSPRGVQDSCSIATNGTRLRTVTVRKVRRAGGPHCAHGPGSRAHDGGGVRCRERFLVRGYPVESPI